MKEFVEEIQVKDIEGYSDSVAQWKRQNTGSRTPKTSIAYGCNIFNTYSISGNTPAHFCCALAGDFAGMAIYNNMRSLNNLLPFWVLIPFVQCLIYPFLLVYCP